MNLVVQDLEDIELNNSPLNNNSTRAIGIGVGYERNFFTSNIQPIKETSSILYYGFFLLFTLVVKNYERNYVKIENEVVIPAIPINIEDAKAIIYDKKQREKIISDGENYAQVFLYNKNL